ncbi:MAG: DUF2269 domain-containing protein [Thermoanaerobaculia bacterium]|nr:DUF2269 domain-containing protein [Thermoanaerobaculia bacterium]
MRGHLPEREAVPPYLFFSNALAAFFWKWRATVSGEPTVIAHTFRTLMTSDRWITPAAVVLLMTSGIAAALRSGLGLLSTGWILWSLVSLLLSGVLFTVRVLPLQRDLARWTTRSSTSGSFDWVRYRAEARRWSTWAHLSILSAFVALLLMLLRPGLPGLIR